MLVLYSRKGLVERQPLKDMDYYPYYIDEAQKNDLPCFLCAKVTIKAKVRNTF